MTTTREAGTLMDGLKLLLTDSEGWAGLYDASDDARAMLGRSMMHADLAGEPLFTRAFLVLGSGEVVPAAVRSSVTPFDEDDYATARMAFTPDPRGSLLGAAAAGTVEFVVSWCVDGRA